MNQARKRVLYRTLNRLMGDGSKLDDRQRMDVLATVSGWVGQHMPGERLGFGVSSRLSEYDHGKPDGGALATDGWLQKHIDKSRVAFNTHWKVGHWTVNCEVLLPEYVTRDPKKFLLTKWAKDLGGWAHIQSMYKKQCSIVVSPAYHLTVAKHGVARDGKKLVQRIWDHREYDAMDVWACLYWDLSSLTGDEHSWQRCTHHEGYVVKAKSGHMAIDTTLSKAIALARKRTVTEAINSILSDHEQPEESVP